MYNYLYTNDMRISDLPDSIKRVSEILLSGMEPYQVDKSFGNNGATIQFYFNLQDNTETLIKGKDATLEVIRKFILKFQKIIPLKDSEFLYVIYIDDNYDLD